MRVALVTEFYYPHLGGVTEHVHNFALELRRRGHEATIITAHMAGERRDPDFVERVGTSRVIYSNGSFARLTTGWGLTRRIGALLRERRIELVHVHDILAPTLGIVASTAAWRQDLPVVATSHTWFRRSLAYAFFRPLLQRRLDRVAACIAVSQPVVEAMSRYFRASWEIIPNGVNVDHFRAPPRAADGVPPAPQLLFLGRLDPRNGLENVLAAMPIVLQHFPRARLTVAGDGPLRRHYQDRAAALGNAVAFVGRVNGERPYYYGAADLYLCPSTKASFGITLLEAMACGTPMVVSDITGFRELIDGGDEAVLVPCGKPDALAHSVVRLLADPQRRAVMAAAGRAKAETFGWARIADRVLAVYERVLR
ncbi:MAG: glycosyltransferase family 4 protein [Gemmatimonadales bacterium]